MISYTQLKGYDYTVQYQEGFIDGAALHCERSEVSVSERAEQALPD